MYGYTDETNSFRCIVCVLALHKSDTGNVITFDYTICLFRGSMDLHLHPHTCYYTHTHTSARFMTYTPYRWRSRDTERQRQRQTERERWKETTHRNHQSETDKPLAIFYLSKA